MPNISCGLYPTAWSMDSFMKRIFPSGVIMMKNAGSACMRRMLKSRSRITACSAFFCLVMSTRMPRKPVTAPSLATGIALSTTGTGVPSILINVYSTGPERSPPMILLRYSRALSTSPGASMENRLGFAPVSPAARPKRARAAEFANITAPSRSASNIDSGSESVSSLYFSSLSRRAISDCMRTIAAAVSRPIEFKISLSSSVKR